MDDLRSIDWHNVFEGKCTVERLKDITRRAIFQQKDGKTKLKLTGKKQFLITQIREWAENNGYNTREGVPVYKGIGSLGKYQGKPESSFSTGKGEDSQWGSYSLPYKVIRDIVWCLIDQLDFDSVVSLSRTSKNIFMATESARKDNDFWLKKILICEPELEELFSSVEYDQDGKIKRPNEVESDQPGIKTFSSKFHLSLLRVQRPESRCRELSNPRAFCWEGKTRGKYQYINVDHIYEFWYRIMYLGKKLVPHIKNLFEAIYLTGCVPETELTWANFSSQLHTIRRLIDKGFSYIPVSSHHRGTHYHNETFKVVELIDRGALIAPGMFKPIYHMCIHGPTIWLEHIPLIKIPDDLLKVNGVTEINMKETEIPYITPEIKNMCPSIERINIYLSSFDDRLRLKMVVLPEGMSYGEPDYYIDLK